MDTNEALTVIKQADEAFINGYAWTEYDNERLRRAYEAVKYIKLNIKVNA